MKQGVQKGYDAGLNLGIGAARHFQPRDPGVLGRIMDVFTGTEAGPSPRQIRSMLDSKRDRIIATILNGSL
jgi:hypothetical protein